MADTAAHEDTTVSTTEAAQMLGISRQRVHKMIQDGLLRARTVYGLWRIEAAEVVRYRRKRNERMNRK